MGWRAPSPAVIYATTTPLCVAAPAFVPPHVFDQRIVWTYILLAGLPLGLMSVLLATIHAQHRLIAREHRVTAFGWAAGSSLAVAPLGSWVTSPQAAEVMLGIQAIAAGVAALLFGRQAARMWKLPAKVRMLVAIGIGLVALLFAGMAYRAGSEIFRTDSGGLEEAAATLAEFVIDAMGTCVVLLLAVVGHWLARERRRAGQLAADTLRPGG